MFTAGARCHDYGKGMPEELFLRIRADGFGCIQLAPKKALAGVKHLDDLTEEMLGEIRRALHKSGLSVGVYGCYVELSYANEEKRAAAVAEFVRSIPFARRLGACCIGSETTPMALQPAATREEALAALRRSLAEILPAAQEHGVLVAIEPVATHAMHSPECTRRILEELASDSLGVIFDPVNLLTAEVADQHALWERCFDCFGGRIAAVHMKGAVMRDGQLVRVPFEQSGVDYAFLFERLRALGKDLPILREEVDPAHGKEDVQFLKRFF